MKRFFVLLLTVAVFVGTVGYLWHAGSGSKKGYTFDLIVKRTDMEFWKDVYSGAQAAASASNCSVTMYGSTMEKDYEGQIKYLKESVARRPDAIILAAADYNLLSGPVQQAIDAGIPVLMVDSDVNNPHKIAYVGTDNVKLGAMLAQQLRQNLKGVSGEVGVVSFVKGCYSAMGREEGFLGAMKSDPRFTLTDTVYGNSDVNETEVLTEDLIARHPHLAAVAALNEESGEGAARALSKLGRKDIPLFAVDCAKEEAMYMEEGILKLALLQNPYQMGYYSVETARRYLSGEKVGNRNTDIYSVDINTLFDDKYQQLIFPFNS